MKKSIATLFLMACLLLPHAMHAQDTITVADGTATSIYLPVCAANGQWGNQVGQILYPDSLLTLMRGQAIASLTYYCSDNSVVWGTPITVKACLTSSNTIGSSPLPSPSETVFNGTANVVDGQLTIELSQALAYPATGGNLLVEFSTGTMTVNSEAGFYGISLAGVGCYGLSFFGQTMYQPEAVLPKTTFVTTATSACERVAGLSATDITPSSAILRWVENGESTSWEVEYSDTDFTPGTAATNDVLLATADSVLLSGLAANTSYYIYVRPTCFEDWDQGWTGFSFTTPCASAQVPYYEGFEMVANNAVPTCWTSLIPAHSYAGSYPSAQRNLNHSHSGSKYLYLNDYTYEEPGQNLIATSSFEGISQLQVSFWAKVTSATQPSLFSVGIVDSSDTYHPIDTISLSSEYQFFVVPFTSYQGTTGHVAFYANYDGQGTFGVAIDDVLVDSLTHCGQPGQFAVAGTQRGEVSLSWSDPEGGYWTVAHGPAGMQLSDPDMSFELFADTLVTIEGLIDTVLYDFYVRRECDEGHSLWMGPLQGQPGVYCLPVVGSDTLYSCGYTIADNGGLQGIYSAYCDATLVLMPSHPDSTVRLSGTLNTTFVSTDKLTLYEGIGTEGRCLGVYGGSNVTIDTASTVGAMTLRFETGSYANNSYYYNRCAGLNLQVSCEERSGCPTATEFRIYGVTGSSASAGWNYPLEEASFFLRLTDTLSGSSLQYTTTGHSQLFYGLTPQTTYSVQFWAQCEEASASDTLSALFTTGCPYGGNIVPNIDEPRLSGNYLPILPSRSSFSQQIFTADELRLVSDTIYGVSFYVNNGAVGTLIFDLYLDTISLDAFESTTQFRQPTVANRYYHDTFPACNAGWVYVPFDHPYIYGHGNLLLTCNNVASDGSICTFATAATSTVKTLYNYYYQSSIDVTNYSDYNSVFTYLRRSLTRFHSPCEEVSCVAPQVSAVPKSNSIGLSWIPGLAESAWKVEYRVDGDSLWQTGSSACGDLSFTLEGLASNTLYQVRVTSLCGSDSAATVLLVRTSCEAVSQFPLVEDFESFLAPHSFGSPTQPCWNRLSTSSTYAYPYVDETYAYSGTRSLILHGTHQPFLVLPLIDGNINELLVSGMMMSTTPTAYDVVIVGVMSDPANAASFSEVARHTLLTSTAYQWEPFELILNEYEGLPGYIAVTCSTSTFYLDNLTVERQRSCGRVQNLQATATTNSIALSWSDSNQVGSYTVRWSTVDDLHTATDSLTTSSTSCSLQGLTPGQHYYAWVRANCTGESSLWSATGRIATSCATITQLPWSEDFESYSLYESPLCWDTIQGFGAYPSVSVAADVAAEGTHSLCLYALRSAGGTGNTIATPAFASLAGLKLSFSIFNTYNFLYMSDLIVGVLNANDQFVAVDSFLIVNGQRYNMELYLDRYASFGNRIAFRLGLHGDLHMCQAFLDNIVVDSAESCPAPSRLEVTAVDSESITLDWIENSGASQWEIACSDGTTSATTTIATTHPYTISGLASGTEYTLTLRALCSASEYSDWSLSTTVRTDCDAVTSFPYAEGFEGEGTPLCWRTLIGEGNIDWNLDTTGALHSWANPSAPHSGSHNALFTNNTIGTSATLLTPFLDLTQLTIPLLSFWYALPNWGYDGDTLRLLYRTAPTAPWQLLAQYDSTVTAWTLQTHLLPDPSATYQIAFEATSGYGNGVLLDDISIEEAPAIPCDAPEVSVELLGTDTALAHWPAVTGQYEYALRLATDSLWPEEMLLSSDSLLLADLAPDTEYQLRVRTICIYGIRSDWTQATFTTDPLPCHIPTDLAASNVTLGTADLTWQPGGSESQWQARYWYGGVYDSLTAEQPSMTLSGLMPATDYHAQVRAICTGNVQSEWSTQVDFRTAECITPTNLTFSGLTTTSVTLDWQENGTAEEWIILYGEPGFTTDNATTLTANEHPYTLTGLTPGTAYQLYLRANCGYTTSTASDPVTFTALSEQSIAEADPNPIRLYPNPATTSVTVEGFEGEVQVIDLQGRVVKSQLITHNSQLITLEALPQGAYFVKLGNAVQKLIVK